jgi:hypothetical protein
MDATDKNIVAYEKLKQSLETGHMGKWVLIHDAKLIATFESFELSAKEAVRQFSSGPYLIRQVGAPQITLPTSVVFNL